MTVRFDKLLQEDDTRQDRMARARALLAPRRTRDAVWPTLAAAAFFALSAMTFAVGSIAIPSIHGPAVHHAWR